MKCLIIEIMKYVLDISIIISLGYTFSYKYHRQGYAFEALTVLHEHLHKLAPEWEFICFTLPVVRLAKGM